MIERTKLANTRHGRNKTKEHRAWVGMRLRCESKSNKDYWRWGQRGITVCERWSKFENFYEDMGNAPTKQHSLGRIDNNAGYCKENCRWETHDQQANNRRGNRLIVYKGEEKTLSQWADEVGINRGRIQRRLESGWTIEKSFETPVDTKRNSYKNRHKKHVDADKSIGIDREEVYKLREELQHTRTKCGICSNPNCDEPNGKH